MNIVGWGCGDYAKKFVSMRSKEYTILGFVDKNENLQKKGFMGFPVYGIDYLLDCNLDIVLCTSASYDKEMLLEYVELGLPIDKFRIWKPGEGIVKPEDAWKYSIYSQDGEECYLKERFTANANGVYVDVGAYHPFRFSNTYWAYLRGWKGINIEPNPRVMKLFSLFRPRDININCGISDKEGWSLYYSFTEPAFNTFSPARVAELANENILCIGEDKVRLRRMDGIFLEYGISHVDFMNIDAETYELQVLSSINFDAVKIDCILLEQLRKDDVADIFNSPEYNFLRERCYQIKSVYNRTVIYERQ